MAYVSIWDIKTEIVNFLRNQDIISTSNRGVTTNQDTGTFSSDISYTLSTSPNLVKNIRSIIVGGSTLVYGQDYSVNFNTGVITFIIAQTGAYTIDYDTGTTDRIFPDFPQANQDHNQFPRIAVDIISGTTEEIELGAGSNFSQYVITIVVYDKSTRDLDGYIATVRSKLMANKKNFFYLPFIRPTGMGPLLNAPFGQNKIFQRNQDFRIDFVYED